MPFDAARLANHRFTELSQSYDARDAILYALGLGLGRDPLDERDLAHLVETRLEVLPSFAGTLASPGLWLRDPAFGIDFARLVHAEQDTEFHAALPPAATVRAVPRLAGLYDRGFGRGAIVVVERTIADAATDAAYATVRQTLLLRGDGGFGGEPPPPAAALDPPAREPDHRIEIPISPRAALIYRLSGDLNPLHVEPAAARAAGFDRPILHGLATYGVAAAAIARTTGRELASLSCRFSGIVTPGDMLAISIWEEPDAFRIEARVGERRVLDRGVAEMRGG